MKQKIRLTEGDLHRIVEDTTNQILLEYDYKEIKKALDAMKSVAMQFQKVENIVKPYINDDMCMQLKNLMNDAVIKIKDKFDYGNRPDNFTMPKSRPNKYTQNIMGNANNNVMTNLPPVDGKMVN